MGLTQCDHFESLRPLACDTFLPIALRLRRDGVRINAMLCRLYDCANDADAIYCNACGAVLTHACPQSSSDALLEGERKQVTVLFADLCGYTALSERLDPEEVMDILTQVLGEIIDIVQRYEGFSEKYVGDAVMAVFGASRAYEDDPLRAVRAAREIRQMVARLHPIHEASIGRPLAMHSGINTGLVILGHLDADHGTHGVSGDSVNIAARLCALDREGDIPEDPDTFLHSQAHFVSKPWSRCRSKANPPRFPSIGFWRPANSRARSIGPSGDRGR